MRIDVKKFLFVGVEEDRTPFFQKAQELGLIQFIDEHKAVSSELPQEVQELNDAIKVVRGLEPAKHQEEEESADRIAPAILELKRREEALLEVMRITKMDIARVHVFGDFSIADIRAIEKEGHRHIQFFCAKEGQEADASLLYVGTDQGMDYYISIAKERVSFDKMIEMPIEEPLGVLQKRLKEKEREQHLIEQQLKKYSKYNAFLHQALIDQLNSYHLQKAEQFPAKEMDGALFSVVGWIPADKVEAVAALTQGLRVHSEEIAIVEGDPIPTYLENEGLSRMGEDLVYLYDTPAHTDKDPSLWVLVFFSLFYAMIIADAGYGIIFLLASLYFFYKSPKAVPPRHQKLVYILCGACIVWGVMINSFFGINIAPDSPLRKISLLQWLVDKKADYHYSMEDQIYHQWLVKYPKVGEVNSYTEFLQVKQGGKETYDILNAFSDNIMMELALLTGIVHICLSFARYLGRNWAGYGWIMAIIGGYLYIPFYLNATSMVHFVLGWDQKAAATIGAYLFIGGFSLAVILSIIQNRWKGLLEITLLIQIFSDILSYLRLYALALAGAIISVTLNEVAGSIPIYLGVILLALGHVINMGLSIMGGVINGLRLNFLEWYHYSFSGDGKRFSPLCKIKNT